MDSSNQYANELTGVLSIGNNQAQQSQKIHLSTSKKFQPEEYNLKFDYAK